MTFMNTIVMLLILGRVAIIFCKYYSFALFAKLKHMILKIALNLRQYDNEQIQHQVGVYSLDYIRFSCFILKIIIISYDKCVNISITLVLILMIFFFSIIGVVRKREKF